MTSSSASRRWSWWASPGCGPRTRSAGVASDCLKAARASFAASQWAGVRASGRSAIVTCRARAEGLERSTLLGLAGRPGAGQHERGHGEVGERLAQGQQRPAAADRDVVAVGADDDDVGESGQRHGHAGHLCPGRLVGDPEVVEGSPLLERVRRHPEAVVGVAGEPADRGELAEHGGHEVLAAAQPVQHRRPQQQVAAVGAQRQVADRVQVGDDPVRSALDDVERALRPHAEQHGVDLGLRAHRGEHRVQVDVGQHVGVVGEEQLLVGDAVLDEVQPLADRGVDAGVHAVDAPVAGEVERRLRLGDGRAGSGPPRSPGRGRSPCARTRRSSS